MTMAGGATVGYCATGSLVIAAPPSTVMNSAITQAKIGRSMKNPESMRRLPDQRLAAVEAAEDAAGAAAPALPGGAHGTGLTGAPGIIFWKPSTITRSPAASPPVTTQSAPWLPPTVILRGAGL